MSTFIVFHPVPVIMKEATDSYCSNTHWLTLQAEDGHKPLFCADLST